MSNKNLLSAFESKLAGEDSKVNFDVVFDKSVKDKNVQRVNLSFPLETVGWMRLAAQNRRQTLSGFLLDLFDAYLKEHLEEFSEMLRGYSDSER